MHLDAHKPLIVAAHCLAATHPDTAERRLTVSLEDVAVIKVRCGNRARGTRALLRKPNLALVQPLDIPFDALQEPKGDHALSSKIAFRKKASDNVDLRDDFRFRIGWLCGGGRGTRQRRIIG